MWINIGVAMDHNEPTHLHHFFVTFWYLKLTLESPQLCTGPFSEVNSPVVYSPLHNSCCKIGKKHDFDTLLKSHPFRWFWQKIFFAGLSRGFLQLVPWLPWSWAGCLGWFEKITSWLAPFRLLGSRKVQSRIFFWLACHCWSSLHVGMSQNVELPKCRVHWVPH